MKNTILNERKKQKEKRINLYSESGIKIHRKTIKYMLIHLAYTSLFIWVVIMQFQLSKRYDQTSLKVAIENQAFYIPSKQLC